MSKRRVPNVPRIVGWSLALILVICVLVFFIRLAVWNKGVKYIVTDEDIASIKLDTNDNITILPANIFRADTDDGVPTILVLGNDSYYEGLDDKTSITDYLSESIPNADIINCCFPGSQLSCYNPHETSPAECPEDYFTLFYLILGANLNDFSRQNEAMMYLPDDKKSVYQPILDRFMAVDFNKVDLVLICYDAHDYLNGVMPQSPVPTEDGIPDVSTFLGTLQLSVGSNASVYPTIQYAYVSPIFCYATDPSGNKVASTLYNSGNGTIADYYNAGRATSDYVGLSFIDMLFGVPIHEETADDYLEKDGITPNKKARKEVADRIAKLIAERL